MEVSLNCLICNQLIICEDGEGENKKCLPFQLGLQLFYKLLKSNVNTIKSSFYFEQAVRRISSCSLPLPCCEECELVLGEMVRLQQSIEEIQVSLWEQVEKLKSSLLTSIPLDYEEDPLKIPGDLDSLEQIREQLLSSVRIRETSTCSTLPVKQIKRNVASSFPKRKRRPPPPEIPKVAVAVPPKKPKEYQPCSVLLERIPVVPRQTPPRVSSSKPTFKTDVDKEASEVDSDPEFVPSPQTGSNNDDDDDDYPWESEAPPINQDAKIKQEQHNSSLSSPIKSPFRKYCKPRIKFSIITPDTLLYQFTLIKVSEGYTQFTCQEPECPSPTFSDPTLNWNNLFTQIAHHIESTHSNLKSGLGQLATRQCPLCQVEVTSGLPFRHHLTGTKGHSIEMVACEICWKPIRNVTDYYRNHQWHHKSVQEKRNCEEGPPSKFRRSAKQAALLSNFPPKPLDKIIPAFITKSAIPEVISGHWGPKPGKLLVNKFSIIFPDALLLYQTTFIKVSPGYTQLTCQELQCPSPIFSTESPLNWYSLFLQMAEHIDSTHVNAQANGYLRPCPLPLCGIQLKGRELRAHLVGKFGLHRVQPVVCEICLKSIRNVGEYYRNHQWRHKNVEDKMKSLEGPPSKIRNKLKKNSSKFEVITPSSPPQSQPTPLKAVKLKCDDGKFWILSPDTLLYHYTLIKVSRGYSELICQEAECPSPIFSTEDPLNWNSLFTQVADHINSTHCTIHPSGVRICPLCEMEVNGRNFRAHLIAGQGIHKNGQMACETCCKPVSKANYKTHQWNHKNDEEKKNDYSERPRKLDKPGEQKPFSCETCGKCFKGRAQLGYHEAKHLPKEMRKHYKCPECPRQFLDAVGVRGHVERVHRRELMRWRTCPICSRKFNWRDGDRFRTHVRSHRNERPFVCETCGMAFLDARTLKLHRERVHEKREERSWQCEFCEMSYKERCHLKRHRRRAHEQEVEGEMTEEQRLKLTSWEYRPDFIGPRIAFPCPACEKVFPLKSRMKKHFDKFCKAK